MYFEEMCYLFNNIPVYIPEPKPDYYKKKGKLMLTFIRVEWYIKKTMIETFSN